MKHIYWLILSFIFIVGCSPNHTEEKTELNKILHAVLKYKSDWETPNNNIFLVNPKLRQLKVRVPSQKEILREEPPPPPIFNTNIVRLLDLRNSQSTERKTDSLNLLKQEKYIFDSIIIDDKINPNIKLANKDEVHNPIKLYQFSNPVYFNDRFVYIELVHHDYGFGTGFGYLLEKQKDGSWIVKESVNTFIT
ncbi:hypothetical protein CMT92_14280 [Elizabethkingia anophelis]|uniref:hypothetical protein n=1 Tax=Elizabethkingia anophelis TaxID=1117645 RepID=UPI0007513BA3|nr:hypothetical protein [Elizabethkingia anophelis]AQW90135.1 hypothetical protein BBD28_05455 [Elizabethkingia anophelis]KUY23701.1 hypothetical protein ATB94_13455 [Elizabethkingia anophelis]MCT3815264.1 hypothetical protein [Elizabethkingia anophelis]MCT3872511.1 hypothetical protein [Elizabethkingia anophelis]MDV3848812.1 hypothetical protein [Elizabethkingia anophelis]